MVATTLKMRSTGYLPVIRLPRFYLKIFPHYPITPGCVTIASRRHWTLVGGTSYHVNPVCLSVWYVETSHTKVFEMKLI